MRSPCRGRTTSTSSGRSRWPSSSQGTHRRIITSVIRQTPLRCDLFECKRGNEMAEITKAVIPAAGLGTRFLPATKAMPKEMLPVVDKPAIQYVVEEAVASGLDDILMIIGRNKNALANHFDRVTELELNLEQKGDLAKLQRVNHSNKLADIHFVRQGDPLGLGHAVLRARKHIGDESFAVLLGDDLIDERDELLT